MRRGSRSGRRAGRAGREIVVLLFTAAVASAPPARAQAFGQWWWRAEAGLDGRTLERRAGGTDARTDRLDYTLSFDLNGYLIHPLIGRFRLGADARFADGDGGRSIDTDRSGFSGSLSLFPRGSHPIDLFVRRELLDYSGSGADDPFSLLGLPDSSTSWGGSVAAQRGFLKGTRFAFDHTSLAFVDEPEEEVRDNQSLDWTGSSGPVHHGLRVERRYRDLGTVDLRTTDLLLSLRERARWAESWTWNLTGTGTRRDFRSGSGARDSEILSLRNVLARTVGDGDQLSLSHAATSVASDGDRFRGQAFNGTYLWRPTARWQIGPVAGYALQDDSRGLEIRAPRLGLTSSWAHATGSRDVLLATTLSYLRLEQSLGEESRTEDRLSTSAQMSFGHGRNGGWRKELDLQWQRDDLDTSGEILTELPDLGASLVAPGLSDFLRARVTLRRRLGALGLNGYTEWRQRDSNRVATEDRTRSESLLHSLQITRGRVQLTASAGDTRFRQGTESLQDVRYVNARAQWRPVRSLHVSALYQEDERNLELGPSIDTRRTELELTFRYALLDVGIRLYDVRAEAVGGRETANRGVLWTVSRYFGGWLPIVSAPERKGVIR